MHHVDNGETHGLLEKPGGQAQVLRAAYAYAIASRLRAFKR